MTTEVLNNYTAISFLANGKGVYTKPILLKYVTWREYERFLKDFEDRAGWRLIYDNGDLEFMPPLRQHEVPSQTVSYLVLAYCEHFDLNLVSAGSTTFRRKAKTKGIEPDECFYIQNAAKVIGAEDEKPEDYLAPDVAVEIDVTHGSLDKFKIYAALEVLELWLVKKNKITFHQLAGGEYRQIDASLALPELSSEVLTEFVALAREKGQTAALKQFRQRLQHGNARI